MATKKVDFGPLQHLIGVWKGDKGMDVAPAKPTGKPEAIKKLAKEEEPYYETLTIEPADEVTNAEEQVLVAVRYHQAIFRKSDKKQFHDEVGYWIWNATNKTVMQSLVIPRAVGLLAGGKVTEAKGAITFKVGAGADNKDWGIIQSPFMQKKAKTLQFSHTVTVKDKVMTYTESTKLEIYGKTFDHTDGNTLTRV